MRSRELLVLLAVSILLISTGCTSDSGNDVAGISKRAEDTLLSPADSFLHISDTLSTDLMLDYGIVTVDDIDANETGHIAILDGTSATVTVISGTGDFIADAGGSGSGPGEFQWPGVLSISEDGYVAVSDLMAGTVRILEPGLDSYIDISGFMMANPGVIWLTSRNSFAGMRMVFRSEDGTTMIGYQTAFWEATSEPSLIYREELEPFTPNDFGRSIITPYPMTCTDDGDILTAEVSTEEYLLFCFEPNGNLNWSMEYPFQRVAKSELEIRIEEDMVERRMQQTAHQADYTAYPYHYSVSMMAQGPEGRIWVLRPGAETSFFDVLDSETGILLFTASLEEEIDLCRLEVTRAGILGVTEGDVPSLVRLSLAAP